jgi:hypothetical protein
MLKNLGARAIVPVAVSLTGFVVVCCILLYSFVKEDLVADTIRHEASLADTIIKSTRHAMLKDDRETLRYAIDSIGSQEGVEHVRIFNKKGLIMFSADSGEVDRLVDKDTAGCNECHGVGEPIVYLGTMEKARRFVNERDHHVLAITAPIYNEESCYSNGCHFHLPEETILGTLDIGFSEAPLRETLGMLRLRMVIFCLMVLVLSVGATSALLRRNVLIPVQQLAEYAERTGRGEFHHSPPQGSWEVESIGANLKKIALLRHHAMVELNVLKEKLAAADSRKKQSPSGMSPDLPPARPKTKTK